MSDFDFSRRDLLSKGARLAGAGLAANMLSCTAAGMKEVPLTVTPQQAPIKGLGENAPVRVGCIGVGSRGTGLLGCVLNVPNVTVKAICDVKRKNLERAVKMVEDKQGHTPDASGGDGDKRAYLKLLARDDIDAVVLATPCYLHGPMYLDCCKAKKNFYGEKPMTITRADADKLVAEVPKAGIVAQIGFQRRATKQYIEGIKLVHDGEIGDIIDAYAAWDNGGGPLRGWFGDHTLSGDWMLEQACHTWDVLNWVAGDLPLAAYGAGRRDIYIDAKEEPRRDVTDFYVAMIVYPKMFVRYSHSWGTPPDGRFGGVYERIIGTDGGAALEAGEFIPRVGDKPRKKVGEGEGDHTQLSINHFFECVRAGRVPNSSVGNGRDATLVGLLVRKAVYERRMVTMDEILKS